jgi:hypothetical protein
MATLTEVSSVSRNIIKWGLISIVVLSLVPVVVGIGKRVFTSLRPPPAEVPTAKYGKLPTLEFASIQQDLPELVLETIEGRLPTLPSMGKVYVVEVSKSRLLSLDRVTTRAKALGFSNPPIKINENQYRFVHPTSYANFLADVVYGGMSYIYDWTKAGKISDPKKIPDGENAVKESRSFIGKITSLPSDIAKGPYQLHYLVASGSAMFPTNNPAEKGFVKVDLFRSERDKMRVVTQGGITSPIYVIVSSFLNAKSKDEIAVVQANYGYSQVFDEEFATYKLRGVEEAWKDLLEKRGYIAIRTVPKVYIRKVSLAYYESSGPQRFLQPVYLFEGDGGFAAYVPAIAKDFIQEPNPAK